ncbi:MAG TPA: EAL domain-containing protein [Candidatus Limnocylindrales bacterium]
MFILYALAAGLMVGRLAGGRFDRIAAIRLRWAPLAVAGFAAQLALFSSLGTSLPSGIGPVLYVASTGAVLAVVVRNAKLAGFRLIALGAASNLAAIVANGGYMPTTEAALQAVGRGMSEGYSNSVTAPAPALDLLVDRFAMPHWLPLANVFSVGDVLIGAGIAVAIAFAMRGPQADLRAQAASLVRRLAAVPRSRRGSVAVFALILGTLGVVGYAEIVVHLSPIEAPLTVPWPVLAVAFFLAESKVIVVAFRQETHSFSLSELPAVVGLFFVDPPSYVVAMVAGTLVGLLLARQPVIKILFNICQYLLGAIVLIAVFRAFAPVSGTPGPLSWVAAFAATVASSVIGATAIATVITMSGAAPQLQRLPQMLQAGAVVAIVNTSLALLAVDIIWVDPVRLWLLAVPLGMLFLAYRAYLAERRKHESLELLYESSRVFQRSPELDSAIVSLLEHAREMFQCDLAELILLNREGPAVSHRTTVGPGDRIRVMVPVEEPIDFLERLRREQTSYLYVPGPDLPVSSDRLFRHAMVSPLRGDAGLIGAVMVADRVGEDEEFDADELRLLDTVANHTATALENTHLERSLAELSQLKEELRHMAFYDSLTGLPNRAMFHDRVRARLAVDRGSTVAAVLFLDLDDFKVVNDSMGHVAGDALLRGVGERLQDNIRAGDVAARLGGDEFAVLLDDTRSLERALNVAQRILESLHVPIAVADREFIVSASVGVAAATMGEMAADDLLRNADVAMYMAKARGKGSVSVYDPEMHAAVIERHELRNQLSGAIRRDELQVHYQPIVALANGAIEGFEALVRWNHPERGFIPPDSFIALAEENGSIATLGQQVLQRAAAQAQRWTALEGMPPVTITVNVSPHQVRRAGYIDEVREALAETGLDPSRLVLEMTETAMFKDSQGAISKLQELRAEGVRIAVDDFGTGYSSLGFLRKFPVDILKIAREFVQSDDDAQDWAFAQAIIALGGALGLTIVAEGIETREQHNRLKDFGCDLGQGFLYARALEASRVSAFVATFAKSEAPRLVRPEPEPHGLTTLRIADRANLGFSP